MPVSLLPQKKREKKFKIDRELIRKNKAAVFAGAALLTVFIIYFAVSIYADSLESRINTVQAEAKNIQEQRNIAIEEEVITLNSKFSVVENLLDDHTLTSKLFSFVESITHPSVYFINFTFRANDKTVIANGSTENYRTFGEQYIALQQNKHVGDIRVSSIKLSRTGKVEFGISFAVDESIFKP